jgi:uncharacterized metal-binding protein YceD (DUF177 family)
VPLSSASELTRLVAVDPWPREAIEVAFEATCEERLALARRFAIPEVRALTARCRVEPLGAAGVLACTGAIEAVVVQECVVTLEPVVDAVSTAFERHLARHPGRAEVTDQPIDPEAIELEALEANQIDLGEMVAEELALALDPYPHAEKAYAHLAELGVALSFGDDVQRERPLAALATLAR